VATQLEIKKGIGRPGNSSLSDDGGELAIDHQTLTLWSKETQAGAVGRVGLADFLALDGTNKMDNNIDCDGFSVVNTRLPTDDYDVANKLYVDMSQDWERISNTGFTCVKDQQYIVEVVGSNPYVNFPSMSVSEIGKFIVLADGSGVWDLPGRHLTVNLNGPLQGQAVGQLVLDIPNVIVTFLWDGYSWLVYTTMASTSASSNPWTETDQGLEYQGRIDTGEVHTHTLEAEYLLGTPRRHYEAVFGRAVPLDEELDSLEKRTVKHGLEIERMDRFIKQVKQEEVNNPVVHEAIYNDKIYGRQNGDWVEIPSGGGGTGSNHDIAAMFFWETRKTFGTEFEGTRWVRFNVAETNAPGYDLMLPDWSLVHQVELQLAWFKGKDPNTGVEYNPRITLQHLNFSNEAIKEDVLYESQEFGWGQGFERDERMFQVRLERGAFKLRVDIKNADGTDMPTSASWNGKTYKNLIAVNGMYLTTDESQK
jgi:hypothetical protein